MSPQDVLTVAEVARYLKVHPNTVYRLARKGNIPAFKMGTDWRFQRDSIDRWMREHEQPRSSTSAAPEDLQNEILHLMHWLLSQGLGLTVTSTELASLLDVSPLAIGRNLKALSRMGYVALDTNVGGERRHALTPEGVSEGQTRFARAAAPPSGHHSVVSFAMRHEKC